jgi:two-component system cell cycle sensor histidine kinase/response regulator CckA
VPQAQPTTASYFAPATILVVDDQEAVRAFAARTLRRDGYQVLLAGSAEEAMDLLTSGADIALLVIDIVMPGTNGYELAAQATRHLSDLKVLLITGDPAFFTRVDNHFMTLSKPFTGTQLRDKVRQVLDGASTTPYPTA